MLFISLASIVLLTASPAAIDTNTGRDHLLVTPRPWPANRVDSPARLENGRLWHSRSPIGNRTPLAEQTYPRTNAAHFGAPADLDNTVIYTRVNHQTVAIDPWNAFTDTGFDSYRAAQNLWLREQGWVLKVRTHVNPRYQSQRDDAVASTSGPQPRATIHLNRDPSAPVFPSKLRVQSDPGTIHRPMIAQAPRLFRVVTPPADPTKLASAPTETKTTTPE